MEIVRKGFPEIMLDNDQIFIDKLIGVIESVDELSSMEINKTIHSYSFRVAPSIPCYLEPILKEVLTFNNMFGIRLELGKSIKASGALNFNIEL